MLLSQTLCSYPSAHAMSCEHVNWLRERHSKIWLLITDIKGERVLAKPLQSTLRKRGLPVAEKIAENLEVLVAALRQEAQEQQQEQTGAGAAGISGYEFDSDEEGEEELHAARPTLPALACLFGGIGVLLAVKLPGARPMQAS
eukprot:1484549-Amphidinium_carterae.1